MKKLILILLATMLLSGCGAEKEPEPEVVVTLEQRQEADRFLFERNAKVIEQCQKSRNYIKYNMYGYAVCGKPITNN